MINKKLTILISFILCFSFLNLNAKATEFHPIASKKDIRSSFFKDIIPDISKFQRSGPDTDWDVEYVNSTTRFWNETDQDIQNTLRQFLRWSSDWKIESLSLKKARPTLNTLLTGFYNDDSNDEFNSLEGEEESQWDILFEYFDDEEFAGELAFFLDILKSKIKSIKHVDFYTYSYSGTDLGDFSAKGWLLVNNHTKEILSVESLWTE